ncbi:Metallo-hydrolase/oxidoreductase [Dentipellis sp. KUC8613]|nr:Metallo-hydrolase/oxidoreductase [Dentipellis sp. KUC8613]
MSSSLPPPSASQPFFTISALEGGRVTIPVAFIVDPCPEGVQTIPAPATPFLLRHSVTKRNLLFDLGIRKDYNNLPPAAAAIANAFFQPIDMAQDVEDSLAKGGLSPSDVSDIFISHIHWDHIGNPARFPYSTFVVGAGAIPLLEKGFPHDASSSYPSDLLPTARTIVLPASSASAWKPVGPFPRALDYYGDGSLFIVDATGHMPGHFNVLLRTSADGGWMYLAGDTCHDWRILTGEANIAERLNPHTGTMFCIHEDKKAAEEHIKLVRSLLETPRVRVAIAHNGPWFEKNKDGPAFWPGAFESL